MQERFKKKILIDLDGVLNQYKGKYDKNFIPEIKDGAKEFLEKLYDLNEYELNLFTTRNLLLSAKWLIENDIDKYFSEITNIKSSAYLTIDDRCLCFKGDFNLMFKDILKFKAWWK